MSLIERVQKFDCATPDLSEKAVHFHDAGAVVGGKCPVPLASEHLFTCNFSPRITLVSEKVCDKLRSEDGLAKTPSFQDQSKSKLANRAA